MKPKKIKKVEKSFLRLLRKSPNNVTTLGVKRNLRQNYPNKKWTQGAVSTAVADIASARGIKFRDNGTYREYYMKTAKPPKTNKVVSSKISKTKAVSLIKNSKGRFFTVTFIKKDKSERILNGNVKAADFMNNQGYIKVKERNGNPRQVNPRTIKALKIAGQQYTVK